MKDNSINKAESSIEQLNVDAMAGMSAEERQAAGEFLGEFMMLSKEDRGECLEAMKAIVSGKSGNVAK